MRFSLRKSIDGWLFLPTGERGIFQGISLWQVVGKHGHFKVPLYSSVHGVCKSFSKTLTFNTVFFDDVMIRHGSNGRWFDPPLFFKLLPPALLTSTENLEEDVWDGSFLS
jgi:hypothetical protein